MKKMKFWPFLKAVQHFLIFFLMVAFLISCCTMLFVSELTDTLGVTLTSETVGSAAKLTFANVILLSLLFTFGDWVRRKLTVDRPIRRITTAAEKVMQGDFSVRIQPSAHDAGQFNEVIDCFNKTIEEMGSVETLRTDFIANVSHELKTPLAVISNYATILQQPGLSESDRLRYAKVISESSRRLASLITNILKLSKLENQQIFPTNQEFDLGEHLAESLLQFENAWEQKQLNIDADIQDDVRIHSDRELLGLVWSNLISNAVKFTPQGGSIGVKLTADEHWVAVSVSDTGCGMKPEVGCHIFEKFYQGDTSHATQGNGLGLALVKRVVDILGGEITVESVFGKGSTFTVRIRRQ